jgi:tRNA(Ile)-lysidine synthase
MARSHPPSLTTLVHRLVRDERLAARGELLVCGVSGGPDSTALVHALALLRRRIGHDLAACGIDHGLRPEAAAELELAAALCRDLGVPFSVARVAVAPGSGIQERARDARHRALQAEAARLGASALALGHTADDRAETVLMRLLRGSGPRGLAAMPPRAPSPVGGRDVVRPLLLARKSDVMLHLSRHGLVFSSDPTNRDRRFLRARVRHEVLPLLEELSPAIVAHLCQLADMLSSQEALESPLAGLGRAQQAAVRRALRAGRASTTVRVSGGRDLTVTFPKKHLSSGTNNDHAVDRRAVALRDR